MKKSMEDTKFMIDLDLSSNNTKKKEEKIQKSTNIFRL